MAYRTIQIETIQVGTFKHLNKLTDLDLSNNNCADHQVESKTAAEVAEDLAPCHPTTCLIPTIPNGSVISADDNSTQTPGDSFEPLNSTKVVCDPSHSLIHEKQIQKDYVRLSKGWQDQEWSKCQSEYLNDQIDFLLTITYFSY